MPKEKSLFIEKLKFLKIKSFVRSSFQYQAERLMPAHKKGGLFAITSANEAGY